MEIEDSQLSIAASMQGVQKENTFNILIATDIHLGYDETNSETGKKINFFNGSKIINFRSQETTHLKHSRKF